MKKTIFKDKYPIYTLTLEKSEVKQKNVPEIIEYFKEKIEKHKIAKYIATFDNYTHTKNLNGSIMEGLFDAQNIMFCFGSGIPSTKIMAARPRSIGICELKDSFVIEFIEALKEEHHEIMEAWSKGLAIKE